MGYNSYLLALELGGEVVFVTVPAFSPAEAKRKARDKWTRILENSMKCRMQEEKLEFAYVLDVIQDKANLAGFLEHVSRYRTRCLAPWDEDIGGENGSR